MRYRYGPAGLRRSHWEHWKRSSAAGGSRGGDPGELSCELRARCPDRRAAPVARGGVAFGQGVFRAYAPAGAASCVLSWSVMPSWLDYAASPLQNKSQRYHGISGPEIKALRRFSGDGFSGFAPKQPILGRLQRMLPVKPKPLKHLFGMPLQFYRTLKQGPVSFVKHQPHGLVEPVMHTQLVHDFLSAVAAEVE